LGPGSELVPDPSGEDYSVREEPVEQAGRPSHPVADQESQESCLRVCSADRGQSGAHPGFLPLAEGEVLAHQVSLDLCQVCHPGHPRRRTLLADQIWACYLEESARSSEVAVPGPVLDSSLGLDRASHQSVELTAWAHLA
jgi:hypothetical protein